MKSIKSLLPELYLIIGTLYYWSLTANLFNWFAIGILALLVTLLLTKNKVLGIVLGGLFILVNLFLVLALLSEFSEFETFNSAAQQLIFVGSLFLGLNLLFSFLLVLKNIKGAITESPTISKEI